MSQKPSKPSKNTTSTNSPYGDLILRLNLVLQTPIVGAQRAVAAFAHPLANDCIVGQPFALHSDPPPPAPTTGLASLAVPPPGQHTVKVEIPFHIECSSRANVDKLVAESAYLIILTDTGATKGPKDGLSAAIAGLPGIARQLRAGGAVQLPDVQLCSVSLLPLLAGISAIVPRLQLPDLGATGSLDLSLVSPTFLPAELSHALNPLVLDVVAVDKIPIPTGLGDSLADVTAPMRVVLSAFGRNIVSRPIHPTADSATHRAGVGATVERTGHGMYTSVNPRLSVVLFAGEQRPDRLRRALARQVTVTIHNNVTHISGDKDISIEEIESISMIRGIQSSISTFNLAPLASGTRSFEFTELFCSAKPPPPPPTTPADIATRTLATTLAHSQHGLRTLARGAGHMRAPTPAETGTVAVLRAAIAHRLVFEGSGRDKEVGTAVSVLDNDVSELVLDRITQHNSGVLLAAWEGVAKAAKTRPLMPPTPGQAQLRTLTSNTVHMLNMVADQLTRAPADVPSAVFVDPSGLLPDEALDACDAASLGAGPVLTGWSLQVGQQCVVYVEGQRETVDVVMQGLGDAVTGASASRRAPNAPLAPRTYPATGSLAVKVAVLRDKIECGTDFDSLEQLSVMPSWPEVEAAEALCKPANLERARCVAARLAAKAPLGSLKDTLSYTRLNK